MAKSFNKKLFIFVGIVCFITIVSLFLYINPPNKVTVSGFPRIITLEQAVYEADAVIIADVKEVKKAKWNTPDGKEKPDATIFRPTILEVSENIVGDENIRQLELPNVGGKIGLIQMKFGSEYPTFEEGEKVFICLKRNYDIGDGVNRWMPMLTYKILDNGTAKETITGETFDLEELKNKATKAKSARKKEG